MHHSRIVVVAPDRPPDEAQRLEAVRTTALLHPQSALRLHDLASRVQSALQVDYAGFNLIRASDQHVIAATTVNRADSSRDASFCGHAILQPDRIMMVPDAAEDPRFRLNPNVVGPPHIRFYAAVPIRSPDGHALGALCVYDSAPRGALNKNEVDLLRKAARDAERFG